MGDRVRVQFPVPEITSHTSGQLAVAIPSWVGAMNQPKGGDTLRLGSKGKYGSCVGGR